MAKSIQLKPDWLHATNVTHIYSVSGCISENFAEYIPFWKHNKYWFFDSVDIIKEIAHENSIDLLCTELLYYEIYEKEFDKDKESWLDYETDKEFGYNVIIPRKKILLGYDIVNYTQRNSPECSILSCNRLAESVKTNEFCLISSFEECKAITESLDIDKGEPGPYRILAVYTFE